MKAGTHALVLFLFLSACHCTANEQPAAIVDTRLLGTWKSDKERTIETWPLPKDVTSQQQQRIYDRFGKLRITYSSDSALSEYEDLCQATHFRVLAKDANSVALQGRKDSECEDGIQQIHFDSPNSFWINSGRAIEYFRRESDSEPVTCTPSDEVTNRLRAASNCKAK
ncbi:MAG: hypothetical protein U0136_13565 [Bdellovibrionota bacterium]